MNLPNWISVFRVLLVPVFLGSLFYWNLENIHYRYFPAALFLVAALSDALDGFIARAWNQKTRLGILIDPLADKILLVSAFIALTFLSGIPQNVKIPVWLTLIVISRDILLTLGAVIIHAIRGKFDPCPNFLGKLTTFFQMILVIALLVGAHVIYINTVIVLVAVLTVLSGAAYTRLGARTLEP